MVARQKKIVKTTTWVSSRSNASLNYAATGKARWLTTLANLFALDATYSTTKILNKAPLTALTIFLAVSRTFLKISANETLSLATAIIVAILKFYCRSSVILLGMPSR